MSTSGRFRIALTVLLLSTSALHCCPRRVWLAWIIDLGAGTEVTAHVAGSGHCNCGSKAAPACRDGAGTERPQRQPRCPECGSEAFRPPERSDVVWGALPRPAVVALTAGTEPGSLWPHAAVLALDRPAAPGTLYALRCLLLV